MPRRPRVLVIDDRPETVDLITYVMGKAGLTVIMARSLDEGMRLALSSRPDLIVCDLKFNGQEGFEFGRRIGEDPRLKHIPRILFTDKDLTLDDHERARREGYIAAVRKPFQGDEWPKLFKSFIR